MIKIKKNFFQRNIKTEAGKKYFKKIFLEIFDILLSDENINELILGREIKVKDEIIYSGNSNYNYGNCIVQENGKNKIIHGISGTNFRISRNSYYSQTIKSIYEAFCNEEGKNNCIVMHLFNEGGKDTDELPHSIIRDILVSKVIVSDFKYHFNIVQKDIEKIEKELDLITIQESLRETSKHNKNNDGPKFIIQEKIIIFNYKDFGANERQSFLYLKYLYEMNVDRQIIVYIFTGNEKQNTNIKNTEEKLLVLFPDIIIGSEKLIGNVSCSKENNKKNSIRNQTKFISNMLEVISVQKCCMCDITHSSILEAAHILPIHKIKRMDIKDVDKIKLATDGMNGIWLCKNHHKLFDNDEIKFNLSEKKFDIDDDFLLFSNPSKYEFTKTNVHFFEMAQKIK